MRTKKTDVIIILIAVFKPLLAANIIGYFTNWGIYGDQPYLPDNIPYENLTHIQYAFFEPQTNGDISSFDAYADDMILNGRKDEPGNRDTATSLVYLAHKNGVKVLASIGGWTGSSNFPSMAGSTDSRSKFCSRARQLIEKYNFDGIDIDWEYPCFTEHNGTPDDDQNFVLLLKELRDTLETIAGNKKIITLAIPGSSYHGENFLVEEFEQYVDYISIMTYDYTGEWMQKAWHNSPLYNYGSSDNWSLNRAMEYYNSRGVPASKLNIGVAFYGKIFTGCEGPGMTHTGAGGNDGSMDFSIIQKNIQSGLYVKHWDDSAAAPYCISSDGEYCSYDDTLSVRLKAQYCMSRGYAGAIIWELKGGALLDGSQPLLDAIANVLKENVSSKNNMSNPVSVLDSSSRFIINKTGKVPVIRFQFDRQTSFKAALVNMRGRAVFKTNRLYPAGYYSLEIPAFSISSSGIYMLKIECESYSYTTAISFTR